MNRMGQGFLKVKKSSAAFSDWQNWLEQCSELHDRFVERVEVSPFSLNEQAAVGVLACGAAAAGYLPLIEDGISKTDWSDRRRRSGGRGDLWIDFGRRCYSFEFKRAWLKATENNLEERLTRVKRDISCVGADEHDRAAGGLIAYAEDERRWQILGSFVSSQAVDVAYHFGPDGMGGSILFFAHANS